MADTGAQDAEQSGGFDESFDALFALAYRVVYRMLGSREDADDIALDTLAKAWLRWDTISAYADAWVARVAGNAALGMARRNAIRRRVPFAPERTVPLADIRDDLVRALRGLPRRQREVVVLRFLGDLSEADVASALGLSVGTVKQHAHRGLEALRQQGLVR